jgi:hypothetical protein
LIERAGGLLALGVGTERLLLLAGVRKGHVRAEDQDK